MSGDVAKSIPFFIWAVVFGFLVIRFFRTGFQLESRSRRFANFGLAFGLAAFVSPELAPIFEPLGPTFNFIDGSLRMVLGFAGVLFAVRALIARRAEPTNARAGGPLVALVLSILHLLMGGAFILFGVLQWRIEPDPATAWTYRSPQHGFGIRLPSSNWKFTNREKGSMDFGHAGLPRMGVGIAEAVPAATPDEFDRVVQELIGKLRRFGGIATDFTDAPNSAGNPCLFTSRDETTPGGQVHVAISITWSRANRVVVMLMFEGQYRIRSDAGRASER